MNIVSIALIIILNINIFKRKICFYVYRFL